MPITETQLAALTTQLLWAAFAIGLALGLVAQRSQFCTMGAVADIVNSGDWSRMRMWGLAAGTAILGFNLMVALGWLQARDSLYASKSLLWLSHLLGGLLFGVGMVLASGCGSKTLIRLGGGSLKSLVVFLVMGLSAYASLRGIVAVARQRSVDAVSLSLPVGQDLPSLWAHMAGWAIAPSALLCGVFLGGGLLLWALWQRAGREPEVLLGGLGVGLLVLAMWWASGVWGQIDEHPLTLERSFVATASRGMESLSFVAPSAYTLEWLLLFSDSSQRLTLALPLVGGVVLGSAVCAVAMGRFRWEGFVGVEDTANHLVGAVLMGVGGVTALGCTVGQGLSGLSTLSLGSFLALSGILAGGWLGVRYLSWRVEHSL